MIWIYCIKGTLEIVLLHNIVKLEVSGLRPWALIEFKSRKNGGFNYFTYEEVARDFVCIGIL